MSTMLLTMVLLADEHLLGLMTMMLPFRSTSYVWLSLSLSCVCVCVCVFLTVLSSFDTQSAHSRTKKLRKTERETVLSGVAYAERLRDKFESLNPQPSWAKLSTTTTTSASLQDDFGEELLRSADPIIRYGTQTQAPRCDRLLSLLLF